MLRVKNIWKYLILSFLSLFLCSCLRADMVPNESTTQIVQEVQNKNLNEVVDDGETVVDILKDGDNVEQLTQNDWENQNNSLDYDELEKRAYNGEFIEVLSGDSYDINMDGIKERIEFNFIKNNMNYIEDCEVRIGSIIATVPITNPTGKVYISCLTNYQSSLQILIDEYGPSNDDMTTILYFTNNSLIEIGKVGGLVGNLRSLGNGLFQSYERASTLQTWYHPRKFYILHASKYSTVDYPQIVYMPKELYAVGTNVKLLRDLPLLSSQYTSETTHTIKKGSLATIIASDDENWIYIKDSNSFNSGWVRIKDLDVIINGEEHYGQEVFDGLLIAD